VGAWCLSFAGAVVELADEGKLEMLSVRKVGEDCRLVANS
jgi:hypothetical protein